MKMHLPFFLMLACLASACMNRPRPVTQFNVETYIRPYETQFSGPLTIVLDEAIPNDFEVGENFRPMQVINFRHSLRLSLYYTFASSFEEVRFQDTIDTIGYSLHLFRVRPDWKIHSVDDHISSAGDVVVSNSTYFVSSLIRYDGMIYHQGKKIKILDDEVLGEQVETDIRQWNEAFVDGVRELCEDLYRQLAEAHSTYVSQE